MYRITAIKKYYHKILAYNKGGTIFWKVKVSGHFVRCSKQIGQVPVHNIYLYIYIRNHHFGKEGN